MSSVSGLNDNPNTVITLFSTDPILLTIFSTIFCFCFSFACIAASITLNSSPYFLAISTIAFVSFGKQDPPYPGPACKNFGDILPSCPIAFAICCTSAPTFSASKAISLINEILTAKNAFDAYFIISAVSTLVNTNGVSFIYKTLYTFFIISFALSSEYPMTTLSGLKQSFTALPSLRNSGFETTSNSKSTPLSSNFFCIVSFTSFPVPTGTVDLSTTTLYPFICSPIEFATSKTYLKSALPSSAGGVPTAMNNTSDVSTASFISDVNCNLPASIFFFNNGSNPGS